MACPPGCGCPSPASCRTTLLMHAVDVDLPGIEVAEAERPARGEDAGRHGVVLIIVLEHARAPYGQEILEPVEPAADHGDAGIGPPLDDWIGLGRAHDKTVDDLGIAGKTALSQFAACERKDIAVAGAPERLIVEAKILHRHPVTIGRAGHLA